MVKHCVPTNSSSFAKELAQFGELQLNVAASRLTTFGLGGSISYLLQPQRVSDVAAAVKFLSAEGLTYKMLGAGSNVIIGDDGIKEVVIKLGRSFNRTIFTEQPLNLESFLSEQELQSVSADTGRFFSFGSVALMPLSRKMSQAGLSGLEFAAGIPATVGGAIWMNAGAHGEEISPLVSQLLVVDPTGEVKLLAASEIHFSYRSNSLPSSAIVLGALFELVAGEKEEIEQRRAECLEYRKRTQPLHLPSAGSVFRNPSATTDLKSTDLPAAAQLLEGVGLKGHRKGGVSFSELHSNWLVKVDESAAAQDVVDLIELAKNRVESEYGVVLQAEIKIF